MNDYGKLQDTKDIITTASIKQELKEQRQMLKLQCLECALRHNSSRDESNEVVVATAKAFYAFVRT